MVFTCPGMEPAERNELRLVFDDVHFSIGNPCNNGDPSNMSADSMACDGIGQEEDNDIVRVLLDPFHDKISKSRFYEMNGCGVETVTEPYSTGLGAAAVTPLIRVARHRLGIIASRR